MISNSFLHEGFNLENTSKIFGVSRYIPVTARLVGGFFGLYLKYVGRELTLILLGLCVLLAIASAALHLELVLSALAAGLVVENIVSSEGNELKEAVERSALPVLIVFFAAAGASLQLDALATIGWLALGLAALRLILIRKATAIGTKLAGLTDIPDNLIWMGLISQAGVTLGLATIVATEFPGWGSEIRTLIVALTGLHVLVGPVIFRSALSKAGEIGKLDANLEEQHASSEGF